MLNDPSNSERVIRTLRTNIRILLLVPVDVVGVDVVGAGVVVQLREPHARVVVAQHVLVAVLSYVAG